MKKNITERSIKLQVSNMVLDLLDKKSMVQLTVEMGVNERTIRRWMDGEVLPSLLNYEQLRGLLTEGGDDDSPPYYFINLGHMCRAI